MIGKGRAAAMPPFLSITSRIAKSAMAGASARIGILHRPAKGHKPTAICTLNKIGWRRPADASYPFVSSGNALAHFVGPLYLNHGFDA